MNRKKSKRNGKNTVRIVFVLHSQSPNDKFLAEAGF